MKPKVFIDGREGTTGLQIYDRLASRLDIELLIIDEDKRKDPVEKKKFLNAADVVFLCLPDAASRESVAMIENPNTKVIDASTAHRTDPTWVYGFPELLGQKEKIMASKRIANPGCHATGFLSMVRPLVEANVLPTNYPLSCTSLTGYSGGGKSMIAEFEGENAPDTITAPAIYARGMHHKHLPEMLTIGGLDFPPAFSPVLGYMYKGMATSIMLHNDFLEGKPSAEGIHKILCDYYKDSKLITVENFGDEVSRLNSATLAGFDGLSLYVSGTEKQTLITALFDNLGKGASGAAVQNMNLILGFSETTGLHL